MSNYTIEQLIDAHSHCALHRTEIEASAVCGCFYCMEIFQPEQINRWLSDKINCGHDETAFCPNCDIDSVIGSASNYPVSDLNFLKQMNEYWF